MHVIHCLMKTRKRKTKERYPSLQLKILRREKLLPVVSLSDEAKDSLTWFILNRFEEVDATRLPLHQKTAIKRVKNLDICGDRCL